MEFLSTPHGRGYARLTGLVYLIIAVSGGFAIAYVPSQLFVAGDTAQSLANIDANRTLFAFGLVGDVVMMLAEVIITALLFYMFRATSPVLSMAAALARFAMVAVMAAMLFFHAGTMTLLDRPELFEAFTEAQRTALAALTIDLHHAGVAIWQIFFAMHLWLLGWLVARSGLFPRLLGYALAIGGVGYLLDTIHARVLPQVEVLGQIRIGLLVLVTVAELGFALWLLFVGPRSRRGRDHASAGAAPDASRI